MFATQRQRSLTRPTALFALCLLAAFIPRDCLAQGNADVHSPDVLASRPESASIVCDRDALAQTARGDGLSAPMGGLGLGTLLIGTVPRPMDRLDRRCVAYALETASDGETVNWTNAQAGIRYQITPLETYTNYVGLICRDYAAEVRADGRSQSIFVRACRVNEQRWQLVG